MTISLPETRSQPEDPATDVVRSFPNPTLIPSADYLAELLAAIPNARHRIVLAAMVFSEGSLMHKLFVALEQAAQRGVGVHVLLDIFTKHWISSRNRTTPWKTTREALADLERRGVRVSVYGRIGLNPTAGRCHLKLGIIDDQVFSFGGINLADGSFHNTDFMLATTDHHVANHLHELVNTIADSRPQHDLEQRLGPSANVLYDAGTPKRSTIYENACALTAAAKTVYLVSQMAPSGDLVRLINTTENYCYFNRLSQLPAPTRLMTLFDKVRYPVRNHYRGAGFIHAKFMLFLMPDGTWRALTGSNNFSWHGVAFGTKEVALLSADPVLCGRLLRFLELNVARRVDRLGMQDA
jgi:phosphatidylserine/phosphatidylglycerophosphate/cardiolipin synthase-like enzyme